MPPWPGRRRTQLGSAVSSAAQSVRRRSQLGGDELAGIRSPEIRSADHLPAGIGGVWGGAAGLGSLMAAGSWT